jgi:hypothetical protein
MHRLRLLQQAEPLLGGRLGDGTKNKRDGRRILEKAGRNPRRITLDDPARRIVDCR